MKFRNRYGRHLDKEAEKASLIGVKIKYFAWLPVNFDDGNTVWLSYYYKTYRKVNSDLYHQPYYVEDYSYD